MASVATAWPNPISQNFTIHPHLLSVSAQGEGEMSDTNIASNMPTGLSEEDDWTRVKDPKEKKRIQNRVAQRTYRHRMKARLSELQARLDAHENDPTKQLDSLAQQTTPENSDASSGTSAVMPPSTGSISTGPFTNSTDNDPTPSPLSPRRETTPQHLGIMQQNIFDEASDDTDPTLFSQATQLLNSPPPSHNSPQLHSLTSPPTQPLTNESPKDVHQDFVFDCLRFQTQLLNRLHTPEEIAQYPATYNTADGIQASNVGPAAPTNDHADGMEFTFTSPPDPRLGEPLGHRMQPTPPAIDGAGFSHIPRSTAAPMDPAMIPTSHPSIPLVHGHAPRSTSERVEGILEHVQAAGFESFDELVTAYYSGTFQPTSSMANEQRLSRNRRLPKVLADIFHAADLWSPWERRGLSEEILNTAEFMLTSENSGARNSLLAKLSPLLETKDGMPVRFTPEMINSLKRSIQSEVPNSWSLAMGLSADARPSWQHDRSNTALATTLLLIFAGTIPNEQLLQLIGSCL